MAIKKSKKNSKKAAPAEEPVAEAEEEPEAEEAEGEEPAAEEKPKGRGKEKDAPAKKWKKGKYSVYLRSRKMKEFVFNETFDGEQAAEESAACWRRGGRLTEVRQGEEE